MTIDSRKSHRVNLNVDGMDTNNISEFFEKYNILGYDNGDGELACSVVFYDSIAKKLDVEQLMFDKIISRTHVPNIISFDKMGKAKLENQISVDISKTVYYNFKRCPGIKADDYYKLENPSDGLTNQCNGEAVCANYTYGELMGHSFACALKCLFDCNLKISSQKPTIIMVGRPSSKTWEDKEQDYAALLTRYLKDYLTNYNDITVLVMSESCAAMSGAVENSKSFQNTITHILDLGSSTFDMSTWTPDGMSADGEDSFRFGGNDLDRAMTAYGDDKFKCKYPAEKGYSMRPDRAKTANLRFKKEHYYGENGENAENAKSDPYTYYVFKQNRDGEYVQLIDKDTDCEMTFAISINKSSMMTILENPNKMNDLFCDTQHPLNRLPFLLIETKNSWLAACEYVMKEFRKKVETLYAEYPNAPKKLVLTGGVSNMPEVRKLAETVFDLECPSPVNPSHAVSKGLGWILGMEIIKRIRQSRNLVGEMQKLPVLHQELLDELVSAACDADLTYYESVISAWAKDHGIRTLTECVDAISSDKYKLFNPNEDFVTNACQKWIVSSGILQKLNRIMEKEFGDFLLDSRDQFNFQVSLQELRNDIPKRTLENPYVIPVHMFFDDSNYPKDISNCWEKKTSKSERECILKIFEKHRSALAEGGEFDFGLGYKSKVQGIRDIYKKQLTVEQDAKPIQESIFRSLRNAVINYVDTNTYYLTVDRKS